jgi:hypothetical protein
LQHWRYVVSSVVGTSHETRDLPCQDASACEVLDRREGGPVLIAVAADGAGSAAYAEIGAGIACDVLIDEAVAFYREGRTAKSLSRRHVVGWLERVREEIDALAEVEGLARRDFACTMLLAVAEGDRAIFAQIGDGAIVVSHRTAPDVYAPVFWPDRGEYANQTRFVTDADAAKHLAFARCDEPVDDLALLTDGLQPLALHYASRTTHAPFFGPVFAPVRREPPGHSAKLSSALAAFLGSRQINQRTDDDKTLILATRRGCG